MYNWTNMLPRIAQQADQAQLPKNTSPAISQNSPHECELDRYPRFLLKIFLTNNPPHGSMECWKWVWLVKQWQACRSLRPCRCCTRCPVCPALMCFQIYRGKPQLGDLWHLETGGRVTLFWKYMSDPLHWCPILQGKQELGFGTSVQENFTNTRVWPHLRHVWFKSD